jgi:hypothetical protein
VLIKQTTLTTSGATTVPGGFTTRCILTAVSDASGDRFKRDHLRWQSGDGMRTWPKLLSMASQFWIVGRNAGRSQWPASNGSSPRIRSSHPIRITNQIRRISAMKRRKKTDPMSVLRSRQAAIQSAEGLHNRAVRLSGSTGGPRERTQSRLMQAAAFYEASARAYQRATLGLLARRELSAACACYAEIGHEVGVTLCEERIASMPVLWQEDDSPPLSA